MLLLHVQLKRKAAPFWVRPFSPIPMQSSTTTLDVHHREIHLPPSSSAAPPIHWQVQVDLLVSLWSWMFCPCCNVTLFVAFATPKVFLFLLELLLEHACYTCSCLQVLMNFFLCLDFENGSHWCSILLMIGAGIVWMIIKLSVIGVLAHFV